MDSPDQLRQLYLDSLITIDLDGSAVDAREALTRLGEPIILLTASNPRSEVLEEAVNEVRNQKLRTALATFAVSIYPSVGASPDGSWREAGWAIVGLDTEEALNVGRQWEQEAIFRLQDGEQQVLGCFSPWIECRRL